MDTRPFLCVPITETEADKFLEAIFQAAGIADAIELRLDYLSPESLPELLARLQRRLPEIAKLLIFTFRPREQRGKRDLSLVDRQAFWRHLSPELVAAIGYADFELDLVESFADAVPPIPWEKVICSWHNFEATPPDLSERYHRMAATPAAVVKIATVSKTINDCLPIFEIIELAKGAKPIIALGMGMPGLMTRVLSISRGAMLTFGSLAPARESAPGQPTIVELRDLYRIKNLSRESEIFGIIGNPVGHSRSPRIHNAALAAVGRNGVYLPFEVADAGLFARDFLRPGTRRLDWRLRGLSVTIPHKLAIMPYLDELDETAKMIGAVNTVVVENGRLCGFNTDVDGAMKPLEKRIELKGVRASVLGAGGSARAISYGLTRRGADVTIYARNLSKAHPLAQEFKARIASIESFDGKTDLVINCTPIGMHGHSEGQSPIRADVLHDVNLVYDLIYTPDETALVRDAKAAGCQTLGGLAMLVEQAAEQFRLWTGMDAPLDVMWQAAKLQ